VHFSALNLFDIYTISTPLHGSDLKNFSKKYSEKIGISTNTFLVFALKRSDLFRFLGSYSTTCAKKKQFGIFLIFLIFFEKFHEFFRIFSVVLLSFNENDQNLTKCSIKS